jgi:hypothetical protein
MSHPLELIFDDVLATYNALWTLGGTIVMDPKFGDRDHWLLTYRHGLRGMLARIQAIDRNYIELRKYQANAPEDGNPNEWAVICESFAGVIFFGMDSTVECFVYAMNAVGFARSRGDFCDITDAKKLRQISPKNIMGGDKSDKQNPIRGYQKYFPRVVGHFMANQPILSSIFEYHDVSKHRGGVIQGGDRGKTRIMTAPKQPGPQYSSLVLTVESLAHEFQIFLSALLPIALQETAAAFGYTVRR